LEQKLVAFVVKVQENYVEENDAVGCVPVLVQF
jgi:hypothetical protein